VSPGAPDQSHTYTLRVHPPYGRLSGRAGVGVNGCTTETGRVSVNYLIFLYFHDLSTELSTFIGMPFATRVRLAKGS
jgi:hypothetical protein